MAGGWQLGQPPKSFASLYQGWTLPQLIPFLGFFSLRSTAALFFFLERLLHLALFPVSYLFSGSLKFPAQGNDIFHHYKYLPHLTRLSVTEPSTKERKIQLEIDLGSLDEVWGTVLNITGPLSNWSFADNRLPVPESRNGGPPSYICRLSGRSNDNWKFWLEANSSEALRVDMAVLDQYIFDDSRRLKSLFPDWVDVGAYSSFISTYYF